jgi:hypothetical protein
MSAEMEKLIEINQRVARMESRMVQLGDHVGANLRTKMRTEVVKEAGRGPHVEVDAADVSLSRIHTALREAAVHSGEIPIYLNGVEIAVIYPANIPQKGST